MHPNYVAMSLERFVATAQAQFAQAAQRWVMIQCVSPVNVSSRAMSARLVEPPDVSVISPPWDLIVKPGTAPRSGTVEATNGGGLLLLTHYDHLEASGPIDVRHQDPEIQRFVCNPLTREMLRLPDILGRKRSLCFHNMGILTQTDRDGRPQFAVAQPFVLEKFFMRFLSATGKWDCVELRRGPSQLPYHIMVSQEAVAFRGRLWWVDLTLGALSVDPFSPSPEGSFVRVPPNSVEAPPIHWEVEARANFVREVSKYRRIGVSQGRLRYAELTWPGPFLYTSCTRNDGGRGWMKQNDVALSYFALEADGRWTRVHRAALWWILENAGPHFKLQPNSAAPQIALLHPYNPDVIYLKISGHIVAVDMGNRVVRTSTPLPHEYHSFLPSPLPPSLGSYRIPPIPRTDGGHGITETTNGPPVKRARNSK